MMFDNFRSAESIERSGRGGRLPANLSAKLPLGDRSFLGQMMAVAGFTCVAALQGWFGDGSCWAQDFHPDNSRATVSDSMATVGDRAPLSATSPNRRLAETPALRFYDDRQIRSRLESHAKRMLEATDALDGETIKRQLADSPSTYRMNWRPVEPPANHRELIDRLYHATVVFGTLYDCGRCDNAHVSTAGGVIISPDGLVLTNYHVVDNERPITMVVMTADERVLPVVEILSASQQHDLALVRVRGEGLVHVTAAAEPPWPMEETLVVSHPRQHYFRASRADVARYTFRRTRQQPDGMHWMEINNQFSQGSSGCGVFNAQGELVGLVSQKSPLLAEPNQNRATADDDESPSQHRPLDMTIYRCVPLQSIVQMLVAG